MMTEDVIFLATGVGGDRWLDAPAGSFLRIPAGVTHDFENRSTERAGALNVFLPGGFEVLMPQIQMKRMGVARAVAERDRSVLR